MFWEGYFGERQGAKKEHSRSYETDEQRSLSAKDTAKAQNYLLHSVLLITLFLASCQSPVAEFYQRHQGRQGVESTNIPGWVVWMGTRVGGPWIKDEMGPDGLRLIKKIGAVRVLEADERDALSLAEAENLILDAQDRGFEELIKVRDGEEHVHLMARIDGEKLEEILVLVREPDSYTLVGLKSRIKIKDLMQFIQRQLEEEDWMDLPEGGDPVVSSW